MEKYSIKINILNRLYPLLVRADEEEAVRKAGKLINDKIKQYKDRFSVKDDLDLVIMCCLELATDNIHQTRRVKNTQNGALEQIGAIDEMLNDAILNLEEASPSGA